MRHGTSATGQMSSAKRTSAFLSLRPITVAVPVVLWLPGLDQELADYREDGSILAGRSWNFDIGYACLLQYLSARTEVG
jgi:hypothetical protein